jgi:hypothetical protein
MVNNLSDYLAKDVLSFTGEHARYAEAEAHWKDRPLSGRVAEQAAFARRTFLEHPFVTLAAGTGNAAMNLLETHWIQALHFFRTSLHCDLKRWLALQPSQKAFHAVWALIHGGIAVAAGITLWRMARQRQWAWVVFTLFFALPFLYGATDAQGARFRLYIEGWLLMLALAVFPPERKAASFG